MLMRAWAVVLLFLWSGAALAWVHGGAGGGGGGGSCPYGSSLGDGCPAAVAANWQQSSFFTSYGPQEGQTYQMPVQGYISGGSLTVTTFTGTTALTAIRGSETVACGSGCTGIPTGVFINSGQSGTTGTYTLTNATGLTVGSSGSPVNINLLIRPPWNVAGVDYPVGTYTSSPPVTDPATVALCNTSPPGPVCRSSDGSFELIAQGANPTIQGFDFTGGHSSGGGANGWKLDVHGGDNCGGTPAINATGTVTVQNNKFAAGANMQLISGNSCQVGTSNSELVDSATGSGTITQEIVQNNTWDQAANSYTNPTSSFTGQTAGTTVMTVTGTVQGSAITTGAVGSGGQWVSFPLEAGLTGTQLSSNGTGTGGAGTYNMQFAKGPFGPEQFVSFQRELDSPMSLGASTPTTNPIVRYNLFRNTNDRIQYVYGATIQYNYFEGLNWNTENHGEWTIFAAHNAGNVPVNFQYDTVLQPDTYVGGWTALVYLSSGDSGSTWTTVNTDHNVFLTNAIAFAVTNGSNTNPGGTNGQITLTNNPSWTVAIAGGNTIWDSGGISGQHGAKTGTQVSGTFGGSGVWNYTGTVNANSGNVFITVPADGLFFNGGAAADWSTATWNCTNNWFDPSMEGGTGSTSATPQFNGGFGLCNPNVTPQTFNYSGNINMLRDLTQ